MVPERPMGRYDDETAPATSRRGLPNEGTGDTVPYAAVVGSEIARSQRELMRITTIVGGSRGF